MNECPRSTAKHYHSVVDGVATCSVGGKLRWNCDCVLVPITFSRLPWMPLGSCCRTGVDNCFESVHRVRKSLGYLRYTGFSYTTSQALGRTKRPFERRTNTLLSRIAIRTCIQKIIRKYNIANLWCHWVAIHSLVALGNMFTHTVNEHMMI